MAAVRVQQNHDYTGPPIGSRVLAFSSNNTAGNLLITFMSYNRTEPVPIPQVSDSRGNVWNVISPNLDFDTSGDNVTMYAAYAMNCAAGANTVTWANLTGNGWGDSGIEILEYSGIVLTSALNTSSQITAAIGTPTSAPVSASITTTQQCLIIACLSDEHTPQSSVLAGTGYTTVQSDPTHIDAQAELLGASAGTRTVPFALSNPSETWIIQVLAFKEVTSGTANNLYPQWFFF
jgi:hypothetical protein